MLSSHGAHLSSGVGFAFVIVLGNVVLSSSLAGSDASARAEVTLV